MKAHEKSAIEARLTEAAAELDRVLVDQDHDAAAAVFTEDAVLGESGLADIVGRDAIRDFLAAADRKRRVTHHLTTREDLLFAGDVVVETARFVETKESEGRPPYVERGRVVIFWRLDEGRTWRISRLIVSDIPSE